MRVDLRTIKKAYINLNKDVTNNKNIVNTFSSLGYTNYERFSAVSMPKERNAFNPGCSHSHNKAMKTHRQSIPLLLMEDDCKDTSWYSEYVIDGVLEVPEDADVVYLGYSMAWHSKVFKAQSINDKWMRVYGVLATHAILFLNDSIDKFIENSEQTINNKTPLDSGYASDVLPKLRVYAPKKVLFYQNNGCVITTHASVEPELNTWSSYNHDGTLNFDRAII